MALTSFPELTGNQFVSNKNYFMFYVPVNAYFSIGVFSIEVLAVFKRRVVMKKKKKSGVKKVGLKKVRAK